MCGISGFSGRKGLTVEQAKLATSKMKILGLYNQSRGVHGCGLYINGEIYKGIDDLVTKKNTKEFANFISNSDFIWPRLDVKMGNTMFLHTRMATHGAHTEANTHPFRIKSQDPANDLVGVHNGTLDNIWDLCKKYDVDKEALNIHVDSKALYTLIDKVGLDILKEYDGAAALIWAKPSDPRTLMVYHGAAKKTKADELLYEERPMWWMQTEEGIYFSSLDNSLLAIRDNDKQIPAKVKHNFVYQITDGKFLEDPVHIERANSNLRPDVVRHYAPQQGAYERNQRSNFSNLRTIAEETFHREKRGKTRIATITPKFSLVSWETKPAKALAVRNDEVIYFHKGRYYRSNGDMLCGGLIWVKGRGVIAKEEETGVEPRWFFHGVMMKNQACWERLVEESNQPNSWVNSVNSNYAYDISRFSAHAVTHLETESTEAEDYFRFSWYQDERRITAKLRPEFSGRCYVIEDGFLIDIVGSNGDDKKTIDLPTNLLKKEDNDDDDDISELLLPVATNCGVDSRPISSNISPYDIVFNKMKDLLETFNMNEVEAMANFVEDQLKSDDREHCAKTVQAEMWTSIRTGIATGRTAREALGDINGVLDSYLKMVIELKESSVLPAAQVLDDLPFTVDSIESSGEHVINNMRNYYKTHDKPLVSAENPNGEESPFPDSLGTEEDNDEHLSYEEQALDDALARVYHQQGFISNDESLEDGGLIDENDGPQIAGEIELAYQRYQAKKQLLIENEGLTERKMYEAVDVLGEMETIADELQANECDFAQEASIILYRGVGALKAGFIEICGKFYCDELIRKTNQTISV